MKRITSWDWFIRDVGIDREEHTRDAETAGLWPAMRRGAAPRFPGKQSHATGKCNRVRITGWQQRPPPSQKG